MINLSDLIIIYLSFGAPFGVFYLLNGRTEFPSARNWLKGLCAFLFWMPFAFKVLQKESRFQRPPEGVFGQTPSVDAHSDRKLLSIQKQFEKILLESDAGFSLYQFRELYERYTGLTAAVNAAIDDSEKAALDCEIFGISNKDVSALSSVCLRRRNRLRISAHQINARREFNQFLSSLSASNCDLKKLGAARSEFAKILNDSTLLAPEESADRNPQTVRAPLVSLLENELWKRDKHELLPANRPSSQMRAMTATSLRAND